MFAWKMVQDTAVFFLDQYVDSRDLTDKQEASTAFIILHKTMESCISLPCLGIRIAQLWLDGAFDLETLINGLSLSKY